MRSSTVDVRPWSGVRLFVEPEIHPRGVFKAAILANLAKPPVHDVERRGLLFSAAEPANFDCATFRHQVPAIVSAA